LGKQQRYFCRDCKSYFQNKKRPVKLEQILLDRYINKRQTLTDLAHEYGKSINWVRSKITAAQNVPKKVAPNGLVIIADATFFGRFFGFLVFRAPELKRNLYFKALSYESILEYLIGRDAVEKQGIKIKAIVLDGRPGVRNVFNDIPVQMCHFHQKQIVQRYLTLNPQLEAGIELKAIADTLPNTNKEDFTNKLNAWQIKWNSFLKQRTVNEFNPKRWHYTHKRLRTAYRSLNNNLPYLFTYQDYPELNIPNTTNSLDGSFTWLKQKVNIHRGITKQLRDKIVEHILTN